MSNRDQTLIRDPWQSLSKYTDARIALGRCGNSLPTSAHLQFQYSHAMAKDAVNTPLDAVNTAAALDEIGAAFALGKTLVLHSRAQNRALYLQRPDLGRELCDESERILREVSGAQSACDIALVAGDGLSATAIETNLQPFMRELLPLLAARKYKIAPLTVVQQCRVACGDKVALALGAKLCVIMIGERPGLSSPDSMGVYMTYDPRKDSRDDGRNCISNIRPAGMSCVQAAGKLCYLIDRAMQSGFSGVLLKDEQDSTNLANEQGHGSACISE